MDTRKNGSRHTLLFYRRTMDRLWKSTFFLGMILAAAWVWTKLGTASSYLVSAGILLLLGAIAAFGISVFAFGGRFMAYVQAYSTSLRIVTPFLRLNVSYRRIRSVRPILVQQVFPPDKSRWSQRKFLEPFYGKTALVLELKGYPINPILLKLFLPPQMFSKQVTGFILVVPDWLAFSTELDSFRGSWLQAKKARSRAESIHPW